MLGRPLSAPQNSLSRDGRGDRLTERRRRNRRRVLTAFGVLLLIAAGVCVWGSWQSSVRVSSVQVYGGDQALGDAALTAMRGSYLGIIPRNSIFFYPDSRIRAEILAAYPDVAAVSLFRDGFTGLTMQVHYRVPIARWCGLLPTPDVDEYCYVFDANGYIYAAATPSAESLNSFSLYAPLASDTIEPLRANIAFAEELPSTFDFARQLDAFGAEVVRIRISGDEVEHTLASGTRITYVLGNEQNAFTALSSARSSIDLTDGSIDYLDLRFDGKVYLKK